MQLVLDRGVTTVIDDEMWSSLKSKLIQKHVLPDGRIYACIRKSDGCREYLHRYIVSAAHDETVDHMDGDTLNNRLSNLRTCTQGQNVFNGRKRSNSMQPYKGIRRSSQASTWYARIRANGETFYSCGHKTAEAAAEAYDVLAKRHHGIFARINFPEVEEA